MLALKSASWSPDRRWWCRWRIQHKSFDRRFWRWSLLGKLWGRWTAIGRAAGSLSKCRYRSHLSSKEQQIYRCSVKFVIMAQFSTLWWQKGHPFMKTVFPDFRGSPRDFRAPDWLRQCPKLTPTFVQDPYLASGNQEWSPRLRPVYSTRPDLYRSPEYFLPRE
jgi:hypothetical protein